MLLTLTPFHGQYVDKEKILSFWPASSKPIGEGQRVGTLGFLVQWILRSRGEDARSMHLDSTTVIWHDFDIWLTNQRQAVGWNAAFKTTGISGISHFWMVNQLGIPCRKLGHLSGAPAFWPEDHWRRDLTSLTIRYRYHQSSKIKKANYLNSCSTVAHKC